MLELGLKDEWESASACAQYYSNDRNGREGHHEG